MKQFAKLALALAITASFVNVAAASGGYYGEPKPILGLAANKSAQINGGYVTIYNHTYQTYIAQATFYPTGKPLYNITIGPVGSGRDIYTYTVNPPDTYVSIYINRYPDGAQIMPATSFLPGQRVDIGPYGLAATANGKPTYTISH